MQVFEKQKKLNINFKTKPTTETADISLTQQDDKAIIALNGVDFDGTGGGSGLPEVTEADKVLGTTQEQIEANIAIPNSGHIGTIHIDTTKSKEEVMAMLKALDYKTVPALNAAQYGVAANSTMTTGLTCFYMEANSFYGIMLRRPGEDDTQLFTSAAGWTEDAVDTLELNIEAASAIPGIDLPVGQLNEQLKDLFYVTAMVPGELKVEWVPAAGHTLSIVPLPSGSGLTKYQDALYIVKADGEIIEAIGTEAVEGKTFNNVVRVLFESYATPKVTSGKILGGFTNSDGYIYSETERVLLGSQVLLLADCTTAFGVAGE